MNITSLQMFCKHLFLHFSFPLREWRARLSAVEENLKMLADSTEGEFLSVGEKLQGFSQRAKEIAKMSSSVASLMAGGEIQGAIEELRKIFNRIKSLENESRQGTENLQQILGKLDQVFPELSGFTKIVKALKMICVFIRIQSASIGESDHGFNTLADDVTRLTKEIEEKSRNIQAQSESMGLLIRQALNHVIGLEAIQQGKGREILDRTLVSLEALTKRHSLSSQMINQLSRRYDEISQRFGGLVMSMQSHDITRQQVEHVQKGLSALTEKVLVKTRGNGHRGNSMERVRMVGDFCELQIAQLTHSRGQFLAAVDEIMENLQGISKTIAAMREEVQEVAGIARGDSFLSRMEEAISPIGSSLTDYTRAQGELFKVINSVNSVGGTVDQMAIFMEDIDRIGEQIKRIALNACIRAAHIGDRGVTLGVLAEAIHQLAGETRHHINTVSEILQAITRSVAGLSAEIVEKKESELGGLEKELKNSVISLQRVNENTVSLLAQTNKEGQGLSDDIQSTVCGIKVHEDFDEKSSQILEALTEMSARSRSLVPVVNNLRQADHLEELAELYTMNSEREVHQSISDREMTASLQENPLRREKSEGPAPKETETKGKEELGPNVELF
jgi:methyl-accepting chemotaxis protein